MVGDVEDEAGSPSPELVSSSFLHPVVVLASSQAPPPRSPVAAPDLSIEHVYCLQPSTNYCLFHQCHIGSVVALPPLRTIYDLRSGV
ncbi:hypothetical protein L2E82_14421 [Cichorium intybus]|uniref:Uncharacterized protein n=1 Tax=Cichorium intybus TaxID=13427 RepID=A0ACB9EZM3_CICIN|nr:hypothetical protein L2E82_14421 [Cichorium intybus]